MSCAAYKLAIKKMTKKARKAMVDLFQNSLIVGNLTWNEHEDIEEAVAVIYNETVAAARFAALNEFISWLGVEMAKVDLDPEQRAQLYAKILAKIKQMEGGIDLDDRFKTR